MKNKIYIEGTVLYERKSGIGNYTKNLIQAAARNTNKLHFVIFYFLFINKNEPPKPFKNTANISYKYIRYFPGKLHSILRELCAAPKISTLLRSKNSIFVYPNFISWPTGKSNITISFIYDLSFVYHSEYSDSKTSAQLAKNIDSTIKNSDVIVTISKNSKSEIEKFNKLAKGKICIVNPALDHNFFYRRKLEDRQKIMKKFNITKPYILFVGNIEPRKNIVGIFDAYSKLESNIRDKYSLVFAGGSGWKDDEIKRKFKGLDRLNIIMTGYIDDEDLPSLYSGASLFVFPSHYEGWGMPVLEAMACGVPVVTSNNSSLPEVAGDAAIMVDSKNTDELSNAMEKVLNDEKLTASMIKKGYKQASKFSWEESGKTFNKIIQSEIDK